VLVALSRLVAHVLGGVGHDAELFLAARRGELLAVEGLAAQLAHVEHVEAVAVEVVLRVLFPQVLGVFEKGPLIIGQRAGGHYIALPFLLCLLFCVMPSAALESCWKDQSRL
jgi:hypothetical protein